MSLIWATRGRSWGFRFLLDGGFADPLPEYDKAFEGIDDVERVWVRNRERVTLRFQDPETRRDAAGRPIPHDFVVFGALASRVNSVDDGLRLVWRMPEISSRFARIWDAPGPSFDLTEAQ